MGLLGALSLTGLLIKNAIVLIEEIDIQSETGKDAYQAILDSAVSRMRPVLMAASTTILGMVPLLTDVFFKDMAVVIMFGLGFASVLTLVVVPVLYAIFFKVKTNEQVLYSNQRLNQRKGAETQRTQRDVCVVATPENTRRSGLGEAVITKYTDSFTENPASASRPGASGHSTSPGKTGYRAWKRTRYPSRPLTALNTAWKRMAYDWQSEYSHPSARCLR